MKTPELVLYAGFGKEAISPPPGTELAGYGYYLQRRATRMHDALFARAVAFAQAGRRYCIISCDLLGLSQPVVQAVRMYLENKYACPAAHVMVVSIHTHTGPTIKHHEGTGEVDEAYVATLAPAIRRACDAAFAGLAPVQSLRFAMHEAAPGYAYNRTGEAMPLDDNVRALRIDREGARPVALVSYACHAVARGRSSEISADYPGQVCAAMAANGIDTIFLNGACGDIDPRPPHGDNLAEKMAAAIVAAAEKPGEALPIRISGGLIHETLQLLPVTAEDIHMAAAHAIANEAIPGGARVARLWEMAMLAKLDTLPHQEPFSVRWLQLGGVPIVALPFETFTLTAALLRGEIGNERALVLGCADELLGYLPTHEDIHRKAYAALESSFLYKRLPPLVNEAERLGTSIGRAFIMQTGDS